MERMRKLSSETFKLPGDRIAIKHGDFYVIKPCECSSYVPLSCPVCLTLYRTKNDEESHLNYECCDYCSMAWARRDIVRWKSGWRPSKEEVECEVSRRPNLSIQVDI